MSVDNNGASWFRPPRGPESELHENCLKIAQRIAQWNQFDSYNAIVRPDIEFQCRETGVERWADIHLVRAESLMRIELGMEADQIATTLAEFTDIFWFACGMLADGALEPDPIDPHRVVRARNEALCRTAVVAWWEMMGYDRGEMEPPSEYYPASG